MQSNHPYRYTGGNWYKGNLHAHSTESDGDSSPEALCNLYRRAGYDFLAISDHHKVTDTSAYGDGSFLTIPATEIGHPHVVHIGADSAKAGEDWTALLAEISKEPGLVFIAHPHWSNLGWAQVASATGYVGMEVYNYVCDVEYGRGYAFQIWDMLIESGRQVWGLAVDDTHSRADMPAHFGGWIVVRASELTAGAILSAIQQGSFYASQGPEIHEITATKEGLHLRCSPARLIRLVSHSGGYGGCFYPRPGERLRELDISWYEKRPRLRDYVRVEIVDDGGHIAWSNPIIVPSVTTDQKQENST